MLPELIDKQFSVLNLSQGVAMNFSEDFESWEIALVTDEFSDYWLTTLEVQLHDTETGVFGYVMH